MRSMTVGKFKNACLRVLDDVAATGVPVVITRQGRPVARLTPLPERVPEAGAGDQGLADLVERAAQPVGAFRSGDGRIAGNHDAALEEIWMDWRNG